MVTDAIRLFRARHGVHVATLPDGLHTPVGLGGQRLSIGERQLIALARTALVDPDLVVRDEATSGLDPETALVGAPRPYLDLVEAWNTNPRLSYATGGHA